MLHLTGQLEQHHDTISQCKYSSALLECQTLLAKALLGEGCLGQWSEGDGQDVAAAWFSHWSGGLVLRLPQPPTERGEKQAVAAGL